MEKITQQEIESVYVQGAPTKLTGTAQENKRVFDKLPLMIIEKINDIIDELSGGSGAESINGSYNGIVMSLQGIVDMIATEMGEIEANYLPKSGGIMTGNLILNAEPTAPLQAASKEYVDKKKMQFYGECTTSRATVAKSVTTVGEHIAELTDGIAVDVLFHQYNIAVNPTLNVDNTGAKLMEWDTGVPIAPRLWKTYSVVKFVYNAADDAWIMQPGTSATLDYYGITKLSSAIDSDSEKEAATPKAVKAAIDKAIAATPWYGVCTTSQTASVKIVNVGEGFVLKDGVIITVHMTDTNGTLNVDLNVNGIGNIPIVTLVDGGPPPVGTWKAQEIVQFAYNEDFGQWVLLNHGRATSTRFGLVTLSPNTDSLKRPNNPTWQVASANVVASAFNMLVGDMNNYENGTLMASNWTNNTYSLESFYPNNMYNLQIELSSTATDEQYEAYNAAGIQGDDTRNILIARYGAPTIDIPVRVKVMTKNWGDI